MRMRRLENSWDLCGPVPLESGSLRNMMTDCIMYGIMRIAVGCFACLLAKQAADLTR